MHPEWSPRISWADLPGHVQAGIEQILGAPVALATGLQGGFSPGTADRVVTLSGGRAFVKAVNPRLNEHSPAIHRKEIRAAVPPLTRAGHGTETLLKFFGFRVTRGGAVTITTMKAPGSKLSPIRFEPGA